MGEYRIAERQPCPACGGTGKDPRVDSGQCGLCAGDGTRWVITDRRIEPSEFYGSRTLWDGSVEERRIKPGDTPLWREVRDDG